MELHGPEAVRRSDPEEKQRQKGHAILDEKEIRK